MSATKGDALGLTGQVDGRVTESAILPADLALMLDLLGQAPVSFHRSFVPVCGSINAALWLSWAMARRSDALAQSTPQAAEPAASPRRPLWFAVSREACEEGTGLTRHQQDAARRELRDRGIVLEQRRQTTTIAIDSRRLGQLLLQQSAENWASPGDQQSQGAPAIRSTPEIPG